MRYKSALISVKFLLHQSLTIEIQIKTSVILKVILKLNRKGWYRKVITVNANVINILKKYEEYKL